ncbi:MAG: hypothetical protein EP347_11620 [Alphaproteobacteria bacterium]|nr:MAG: hypothetical protein EP347_11620 [Alphaproteobacteria bacterium]
MTTSGLNLTPGDLAYWKRQLEREAQMRRYGNNIQSQVPAHIRQALEQQAAPQSARDYPWPGQYPTRKQELPKDITGLPNWSEDDIRQLDPQIRQELFGSWQTDLIPATIRLSKIFKREEEDKQIQAQLAQARLAGYTVMGDVQNHQMSITGIDPDSNTPIALDRNNTVPERNWSNSNYEEGDYLSLAEKFEMFKDLFDEEIESAYLEYNTDGTVETEFTVSDGNAKIDVNLNYYPLNTKSYAGMYRMVLKRMIINYSYNPQGTMPEIQTDIENLAANKPPLHYAKTVIDRHLKSLAQEKLDDVEFHEFVHANQGILGAFFTSIRRYGNRRVEVEAAVLQILKPLLDKVNTAKTPVELEQVLQNDTYWSEDQNTFVEKVSEALQRNYPNIHYNGDSIKRVAERVHSEVLNKREKLLEEQAIQTTRSHVEEEDLP